MMLNDVTTSYDRPPEVLDITTKISIPYPPKFVIFQKKLHPQIKPLQWKSGPQTAYLAALALAKKMERWEIVSQDAERMRIQCVTTTKLLRFKDDVTIEIRGADPSGDSVTVQMRSRSRMGRSDLGTNARRISDFLERLSAYDTTKK